jgi:hypothetical protein
MGKRNNKTRNGLKSRRNIDGNATWPDFFIHLIDAIMESINKGSAFVLFGFIFFIGILLQSYRMTPEGLDAFWIKILNTGSSGFWAATIIGATNLGWWVLHRNRIKIMQGEIDRLCEIRRKLMHGEELTYLEQHVHSDSHENNQTMIFPTDQTVNKRR